MPRALRLTVLTVAFAMCLPPGLAAAPGDVPLAEYVHQVWQRAQGLPQDSVSAVLQTRDGFVWLGTQEGLVRFNGVRFTLFNRGNTPAFSHNEVTALAEGPDGALWIGTFGGLLEYRGDRFVRHPAGKSRQSDVIVALAVDRQGAVWVGTAAAGVNRFADGRFEFVTPDQGLASAVINDVAVDGAGDIYVATSGGLSALHAGRWATYDTRGGLPAAEAWRVLPAPDGRVWIATRRGLAVLEGGVVRLPSQPAALASASLRSLALERDGALWAGTENGTAWRWDGTAWSSLDLAPLTTGNYLWSIVEDREGNVWVGTYMSGLHRLRPGRVTNFTHRRGLADDVVRVVLQTRDGAVWIATEANGLSRFDGTATTNFGVADGLPHSTVRTLFEDASGVLWAGSRGGVARFDGTRFRALRETSSLSVRALADDASGTLWVGGATEGVFRLIGGRTLVAVAEDGRTPLPKGAVRAIVRDRAGTMWIGTDDGLVRWRDGAATVLTAKDGLPEHPVYAIHEDADGVLWFGTYGGGVVRLKDGVFTQYTQAMGLFDDVAYQILEDGGGNLWISCNNGVYRVAKAQLDAFADGALARVTSVSYGTADGMLSSECNGNAQPAGWKTTDGRLWFPTTAGVAVIPASDVPEPPLPPLVAIQRVAVDGTPHPAHQPAEIGPGSSRLEFEYSGLTYVAPEKTAFRYRLDGFDADWVDAGSRRETVYTNLPPGRYVFRVAARNGEGVWSEADAQFAFVLRPWFYQTMGFRAAALLAGLLAMGGVVQFRAWRHRQRERELAQRVEQAMSRIKILSGLIPICANCKKIRDDRGYWNRLEQYLTEHSQAVLTHGICPECVALLYPELDNPPGDDPRATPG